MKQIRKLVEFSTIKKARLKVGVDLMHGCGRGYLDALLQEAGGTADGAARRPGTDVRGTSAGSSAQHLGELRQLAHAGQIRLGLATDGDADRFGVVDANGDWLTPNQVLALTLYHLAKNRGWRERRSARS